MTSPALSRRVVAAYVPLWLLGAGFLWWPWVLVRLLLRTRSGARPPLLLAGVAFFLAASLVLALAQDPPASRVLSAGLNLSIWLCVVLFLAGGPSREQLTGIGRGLVDVALVQGVLTILAWAAFPRFQSLGLPLGWVLPATLTDDPSIAAFTSTNLAYEDYFAGFVIRSGGLFGNPTWAGSLAAIGILLLLVGTPYIGRHGAVGALLTLGCVGIMTPSLVLAYSRNTVLALVLALGAAALIALRRRVGAALFAALVSFGAAAFVAVLLFAPVVETVTSLNETRAGSAETRGEIYAETLERVADAPTVLLGSGIKEREPGLVASVGSHSTYLGLLYRGGAVAVVLLVVALVVAGLRAYRHRDGPALALVVFTAVWSVAEDLDVGHFVPLALAVALARLRTDRTVEPVRAPVAVPA